MSAKKFFISDQLYYFTEVFLASNNIFFIINAAKKRGCRVRVLDLYRHYINNVRDHMHTSYVQSCKKFEALKFKKNNQKFKKTLTNNMEFRL